MTLDLLSHMTLANSLEDLSTYPYGVAALDTPLGGRAGVSQVAKLTPFAPSEASIFPRFVRPSLPSSPVDGGVDFPSAQSYPDINFLIFLFAFRYRRLLRHPSNAASRPRPPDTPPPARAKVNWAGMSLNAYYAAVRRALVVAVFLRSCAAVGGILAAGLWIRGKLLERSGRRLG